MKLLFWLFPHSHFASFLRRSESGFAVLYAIMDFPPYLYGREFNSACDYEPIHWKTCVKNPGARLLRWRLRLQDYQYKFECKPGKLNRGVEALSRNPATETYLASSTESSEYSDDSGGMSQSHSPPRRRVNPETARSNGHKGKLLSTESHQ